LFVRGGTVLPLLQHEDCFAILACIHNAVTLEVYLDSNGNAYGSLYLDDGETFAYLDENGSSLIQFSYEYNTLSSSFVSGSKYNFPETQKVTKIVIYGLESNPAVVLGGNVEIDYLYNAEKKALYTSGYEFELGQGKMLELAWN
jgi:alpha-glucosidase (family GH31 glycosyl hydrolase)